MITDSLLQPVAGLINRGIDLDESVQNQCDALEGKTLRVHAHPLPAPVTLTIRDGVVECSTDLSLTADVDITGSVIELNRLMFIDNEAPIREGHVDVSGQIELADDFRKLLIAAAPDLAEELADWIGDSAAGQISEFLSSARLWLHDFIEDTGERTAERLRDQARLPENEDIAVHLRNVDELVNDVERLEARIQKLQERTPA